MLGQLMALHFTPNLSLYSHPHFPYIKKIEEREYKQIHVHYGKG